MSAQLRELEERVHRLERSLLAVYAVAVAVLLIAGVAVPFFTETRTIDGEEETTVGSVVGTVFGLPAVDAEGSDMVLLVLTVVGFAGLLLVTAALVLVWLPAIARGRVGPRMQTALRVLVTLGVIGSIVPCVVTLMSLSGRGNSAPGWGGVLLLAGMLLLIPAALMPADYRRHPTSLSPDGVIHGPGNHS